MNRELAKHISLMAAPLYAAMLAPWLHQPEDITPDRLSRLRRNAIRLAHALWLDTLDHDA